MRRTFVFSALVAFAGLVLGGIQTAEAACTGPNTLTNGTTADATQVMANFSAVTTCINGAPAGSTNALQYNAGSGAFGALGPLTNGQIPIGSTGSAPVAATLTAGPGVTITNAPGSITISSGTAAIYTPPLIANFTWGNQPTGTTGADSSTGLAMYQPTVSGNWNAGVLWDNTPIPSATDFTVTVGVNPSILTGNISMAGLAIGDGTGKFIMFDLQPNSGYIASSNYMNSYTSYSGTSPTYLTISQNARFLQVTYDGTNFNFSAGADMNSLVPIGSRSATEFIGAPTQLGLFVNGYSQPVGATFFHYHRTS